MDRTELPAVGVVIEGGNEYAYQCLQPHFRKPTFIPFVLKADQVKTSVIRGVVEFTQPGRAMTFYVPIVLVHAPAQ